MPPPYTDLAAYTTDRVSSTDLKLSQLITSANGKKIRDWVGSVTWKASEFAQHTLDIIEVQKKYLKIFEAGGMSEANKNALKAECEELERKKDALKKMTFKDAETLFSSSSSFSKDDDDDDDDDDSVSSLPRVRLVRFLPTFIRPIVRNVFAPRRTLVVGYPVGHATGSDKMRSMSDILKKVGTELKEKLGTVAVDSEAKWADITEEVSRFIFRVYGLCHLLPQVEKAFKALADDFEKGNNVDDVKKRHKENLEEIEKGYETILDGNIPTGISVATSSSSSSSSRRSSSNSSSSSSTMYRLFSPLSWSRPPIIRTGSVSSLYGTRTPSLVVARPTHTPTLMRNRFSGLSRSYFLGHGGGAGENDTEDT